MNIGNITRSWKTSVFGAIILALSGFQIYLNPTVATNPEVMGGVATGLGLLLAKDSDKTGVVPPASGPASLDPKDVQQLKDTAVK